MMINEILTWKNRQLDQDVVNAYLPVLPKFIKYFESCMKQKKVTTSKKFKGVMDEELYPVDFGSKDFKALAITIQTRSYLIVYKLTAEHTNIIIYPFDARHQETTNWLDIEKNQKPCLKQLLKGKEDGMFQLAYYSTSKGSKVISRETGAMYGLRDHISFLSTLEFTCLALADKGCKAFNAKELYDNFKPFYDEYTAVQAKRDAERAANPLPVFTDEMKAEMKAKFARDFKAVTGKEPSKRKKK